MDDLVTDTVERAMQSLSEQLEYELRGAWRAGYDYVHLYEPMQPMARQKLTGTLSLQQFVLPSHAETPPRPDGVNYIGTYDIGAIPDSVIRRHIRSDPNP